MKTCLLQRDNWDLCLTSDGNIAVASEPYSIAQDVASAIRTFQGECFYDTTLGIPYWTNVLGQYPSRGYLESQFIAAAETVPGVVSATCSITGTQGRAIVGTVQVKDTAGNVTSVAITGQPAPRSLATPDGTPLSIGGLETIRV